MYKFYLFKIPTYSLSALSFTSIPIATLLPHISAGMGLPHSLKLPSGERRIDSKKKKKNPSHITQECPEWSHPSTSISGTSSLRGRSSPKGQYQFSLENSLQVMKSEAALGVTTLVNVGAYIQRKSWSAEE